MGRGRRLERIIRIVPGVAGYQDAEALKDLSLLPSPERLFPKADRTEYAVQYAVGYSCIFDAGCIDQKLIEKMCNFDLGLLDMPGTVMEAAKTMAASSSDEPSLRTSIAGLEGEIGGFQKKFSQRQNISTV